MLARYSRPFRLGRSDRSFLKQCSQRSPMQFSSTNCKDGTPSGEISKRESNAVLYCQGVGLYGALGWGSIIDGLEHFQEHPMMVTNREIMKNKEIDSTSKGSGANGFHAIQRVSAGWGHSAMVDDTGGVMITGRSYDFRRLLKQHKLGKTIFRIANMFGSSTAGHKDFKLDNIVLKPTPLLIEDKIVDVKCSAGGTMMRSEAGALYFVGDNYSGQSGIVHPSDRDTLFWPEKVLPLVRENIVDFDYGYHHILACNSAGELFCWGRNSYGQLGDQELVDFTAVPTRILVKSPAIKRPGSGQHARDRDAKGEKGTGSKVSGSTGSQRIVKVSAGFAHSFVLTDGGEVYGFGRNMAATMRPNKVRSEEFVYSDEFQPRKITFPDGVRIVNMESANYSTVFACDKGGLYAIGMDESRQVMCQLPIPVERPVSGSNNSDNNGNNGNNNGNDSVDSSNPLTRVDEIRKPMKQKDYHSLRVNGVVSFAVSKLLNDSNSFAKWSADDIITEYKSMLKQVNPVMLEGGQKQWQLKKGMHRVAVLNDESKGSMVSEVVIHEGRAYIVPSSLQMSVNGDLVEFATSGGTYRVVDFSQGWQHSLVIVESRK